MFSSLTTSDPHCRVEITGVCGFWPLPHSMGQEKVAQCAPLSLGLGASFLLMTKIWCQPHRGGFNGCAAEGPATRNSVNECL